MCPGACIRKALQLLWDKALHLVWDKALHSVWDKGLAACAAHLVQGAQLVLHKVVPGAGVLLLQMLQHLALGLPCLGCGEDPIG